MKSFRHDNHFICEFSLPANDVLTPRADCTTFMAAWEEYNGSKTKRAVETFTRRTSNYVLHQFTPLPI